MKAEVDVCIMGGGAAGIALASELADSGMRITLIESGGLDGDPGDRGAYEVIPGAEISLGLDKTKPALFGGNTNYWFGNCRPLDAVDFEQRDWIPHSGWPINRDDLVPYYVRAQSILDLGDIGWYDLEKCLPFLEHPPLEVDERILQSRIVQRCPPENFVQTQRERLVAAPDVEILTHRRVSRLLMNDAGDRVHAAELLDANGEATRVESDVFVLTSGGIENARLLLVSTDEGGVGIGNGNDLVGRFFMEHWFFHIGLGAWLDGDLVLHEGQSVREDGEGFQHVADARVWAQLVLRDELMAQLGVSGLSLWFVRQAPDSPSLEATRTMVRSILKGKRPEQAGKHLQLALSDPKELGKHALRKLRSRNKQPEDAYELWVQIEQAPHRDNRVRSGTTTDRWGQVRPELQLGLSDEEVAGHGESLRIAADGLGLNGARLAKQMRLMLGIGAFGFFWHHMGTTRMGIDPAESVVDENCRVHGVSNLFVGGSSVFPTGGTAAPTLTIIALALRLADHIRQAFASESPALEGAARPASRGKPAAKSPSDRS